MEDYPEIDANVTESSLREAAAVMDSLADAARIPSAQYAEYLVMGDQLRKIADAREERRRDTPDREIPIPPEAMGADAFHEIVQSVEGYANNERSERNR